jgi:hypothetical protein
MGNGIPAAADWPRDGFPAAARRLPLANPSAADDSEFALDIEFILHRSVLAFAAALARRVHFRHARQHRRQREGGHS